MKRILRMGTLVSVLFLGVFVASTAQAATTKIYTSRKDGFSLRYNATWKTSTAPSNIQTIYSFVPNKVVQPLGSKSTYAINVVKMKAGNGSLTSLEEKALKKSWSAFVTKYSADFPGESDMKIVYGPVTYWLKNYSAKYFTAKDSTVGDTMAKQVVLVTKNGKTVYQITGTWNIVGKSTMANPYAADFRAFAQSFRIL